MERMYVHEWDISSQKDKANECEILFRCISLRVDVYCERARIEVPPHDCGHLLQLFVMLPLLLLLWVAPPAFSMAPVGGAVGCWNGV